MASHHAPANVGQAKACTAGYMAHTPCLPHQRHRAHKKNKIKIKKIYVLLVAGSVVCIVVVLNT